MYYSKASAIIIIILLSFSSCLEQANETGKVLYPIDSLLSAQAILLANANATLEKVADIDGKEETQIIVPGDTTSWKHELDIFASLSAMNAPTSVDQYTVEDGVSDKSSNLTILSYSTSEDLPVIYLKVFYQDELHKLRRIEALYHEENALLKGTRRLILEFRDIYDRPTLTGYSVEGGHEMFLSSNVKYSVRGSITLP